MQGALDHSTTDRVGERGRFVLRTFLRIAFRSGGVVLPHDLSPVELALNVGRCAAQQQEVDWIAEELLRESALVGDGRYRGGDGPADIGASSAGNEDLVLAARGTRLGLKGSSLRADTGVHCVYHDDPADAT